MGATTTTCAGNADGTSQGSTGKTGKQEGSVVRCDGPLSCDVVLRRATTNLYARNLHGRATSAVVAATTAEFACLLITRELITHVACAVGSTFLASKLITALKNASSAGDCLQIHLQAPGVHDTWKPLSYGTDSGSDCAD